ncbi:MAG TPA: DUF1152 domain-containing protein [Kofleriaceae bacterium]|nr:DUF1152 domain-containing protein [Kofleriaceae bacterium]
MTAASSFARPALFERLADRRSVLVAGAGGGFDIYAGLPLVLALRARGVAVHLANLSFTYLGGTTAPHITPELAVVTPDVRGEDRYFPERTLARWLAARGEPAVVHAFEKTGVRPLRAAYRALCRRLAVDAVVLVDGGTDILMRGDEAGLGTPEEDMTSLAAVHALAVPVKLVCCIGFGVDAHHGVCHAHFLENVAALDRDGAYLGAVSVPHDSIEGAAFLEAVADAAARTPGRPSIVNGSIAAAVRGDFGDVQFTERTSGSELFINPLMGLYFAFDLDAVARRSLYLPLLARTDTLFEVSARIEAFRQTVERRPRRSIPH